MVPTQAATGRCLNCGGQTRITPTMSVWEFRERCGMTGERPGCTGERVISWAHHRPPPRYVPAVVTARDTLPLFAEDITEGEDVV